MRGRRYARLGVISVVLCSGIGCTDEGRTDVSTNESLVEIFAQTLGRISDEGEAYVIGSLRDGALDDAGRVYLLDTMAGRVLTFDSAGSHQGAAGQFGEGPGELSTTTTALAVDRNGSPMVVDIGRRAVLRVADGTDGGIVQPLPRTSGIERSWQISDDTTISVEVVGRGSARLVRWMGSSADTLFQASWPAFEGADGAPVEELLAPQFLWDARSSTATFLYSRMDSLIVETDGARRRIRVPGPVPATIDDQRHLEEMWRQFQEARGVPQQVVEMIVVNLPDALPRVADLHLDSATGFVWLSIVPDETQLRPGRWLVDGLEHLPVSELRGVSLSGGSDVSLALSEPSRVLDAFAGRILLGHHDTLGRPSASIIRPILDQGM